MSKVDERKCYRCGRDEKPLFYASGNSWICKRCALRDIELVRELVSPL